MIPTRIRISNRAPSRQDNPFATCWTRPGAIPFRFVDGNSVDQLVAKLGAQNWWGEIIGPHGSGKSTLLQTLKPQLAEAGQSVHQITLRDGQRRLPYSQRPQPWTNALSETAEEYTAFSQERKALLLIIDGYEQLGRFERWKLKRRCRRAGVGLLVTAHCPTGLPTLLELAPDRRLIEQLVANLCAKLPSPVSPGDIAASHARHGSNVREVLFALYDRHERLRRTL